MKIKITLLAVVLAAFLSLAQPQARALKNLPSPESLPDYVVLNVTTSDYVSLKARIKNQGVVTAGSCYMAITIKTSAGKIKVFSPKVNGLLLGQETDIVVNTGMDLIEAEYEARVDRSNSVKESNEANNILKGKFGGKP